MHRSWQGLRFSIPQYRYFVKQVIRHPGSGANTFVARIGIDVVRASYDWSVFG